MMAWGIEARVPFLDREFIDYAMGLDPKAKMGGQGKIEKAVIREAFKGVPARRNPEPPKGTIQRWRRLRMDRRAARPCRGRGERWRDGTGGHSLPHQPAATKEAYFYRTLFEEHFPTAAAAATVPGGRASRAARKRPSSGTNASSRRLTRAAAVDGIHNDAY